MSEELITSLSPEDKDRLEMTGIELEGENRSGSFIQTDQHINHSSSSIEGIEMLPLDIALNKYDWLKDKYWNLVKRDKDEATKIVSEKEDMDGPRGFCVIARKGSKNVFPLQSCLFMKSVEIQTVHNIIVAEEGAELHLITGCTSSSGKKKGTHYGITEIYVGKDALVTNTMIHTWGENIRVIPRSATVVEENGTFLSNYVSMNPVGYVQMYPVADLVGKNAVARFNSIVVAPKGSELDLGQRAILNAEGTSAELISRLITTGGKSVSRAHVIGAAPGTKGHIECKGLILKDGTIHAIPEIEGRLTNTELSHEAAVGKIARDEIEYLMARGLDEEEATATIIRGFLDVKIKGLPDSLQKKINMAIDAAESGF
ncbi:SufD family Fe-S cluster assembly protein [Methanomicrobium antiquum]|uniref:SufD family Fe-S cluster assembly protein n=2 Tax=Methanomicrobium antiquum TaxID=487686 RepID=A0AAF0FM87_9EURY|nr:SufD family Fe-S cluster assembly protein [Methanomicrobium antiquum]MDD3976787.1 SufD family Fe-S cluster assembly protein [Methanomicrobium sp.]WFN36142.1 SufD family Fe-S cluster assembly protein [Methanomicrobium antiquum]